jgi:two-component system, cell cycle sensor histidine kinase and response regulator CckA
MGAAEVATVSSIKSRGSRGSGITDFQGPLWSVSLANIAQFLATGTTFLGAIFLAWIIPGRVAQTCALVIAGLACVSGFAIIAASRAQKALSTGLDILRQVLGAAADAQAIIKGDGTLAFANNSFMKLFAERATSPLDYLQRSAAFDPESAAEFRRLRSWAASGNRASAEFSVCDQLGSTVTRVMVSACPVAAHPGYTLWSIRDVTARFDREALVRGQRDQLADFFDNAPLGLYSVDRHGRFRLVNQTLAEWLGINRAELLASRSRLHDFLPACSGAEWSALSIGDPKNGTRRGEALLRTRQGHLLPVWIGENVIGAGDELHTCSVVCDLTPEREWRAALKSARRFERFFANAPVGSALLDRRGHFEEANRALGELFAAVPRDLIGQELVSLLGETERDIVSAKLSAAVEGRVEREPIELRIRDKKILLYCSRIDDAENDTSGPGRSRAEGVSLHFIDVTEQRNLELQFVQSQKMQAVGQLAGGVAHDFNNLLTAMIGFCDLLLLRFQPGDPSFADIMQIQQNANRAANLVRQLLAFSRQQALQPRILNITDVLVDISHLLRRLIGENIELKVVHGRELGLAKVDQGQLEQVIINLAVNARDAMPHGGTLAIRTANVRYDEDQRRGHEQMPAGEYVLIEVTDTGVGIVPENLARIFDPFFSTKEVGSGTGLGLSTAYGIIKQTGGFIFVESTPGEGSTFEIFLPRCSEADQSAGIRSNAAEPLGRKDLTGCGTVLLVEDEDPVRKFGARALRNKGYSVIEAESGVAALEIVHAATEKIDLLVTDVVMPRLDGPELVRKVREICPDIKVIFISGYAEDAFRRRLDSEGNIEFLPKPFSLSQLAAKVKDVIGANSITV